MGGSIWRPPWIPHLYGEKHLEATLDPHLSVGKHLEAKKSSCCENHIFCNEFQRFYDAIMGRLGPSWGHLGAILGHLGAILGRLGAILGPSWDDLGQSWGVGRPKGENATNRPKPKERQ